jgi:hypothetical protein
MNEDAVVIPDELIGGFRACAALKDNEHWAVYIALMKHDGFAFDKLVDHFKSNYHEMAVILEDLVNAGLVEEFTIWDSEIGGDYSRIFYRVTTPGIRFYFRIFEAVIPTKNSLARELKEKRMCKVVSAYG